MQTLTTVYNYLRICDNIFLRVNTYTMEDNTHSLTNTKHQQKLGIVMWQITAPKRDFYERLYIVY